MVLGYSRHLVCRLVFDQRIETWLQCHVEAFAELGGVPAVLVPDNLKAAVIRAAFGVAGTTTLNRSYRECARHYGFKVDPAPIRSPEKKGKVEAAVKYVKRNFFAARREELDAGVLAARARPGGPARSPASAATARRSAARSRSSPPWSSRPCARCRRSPTSRPSGRRRPCITTRTSASGAPSTRCRGG